MRKDPGISYRHMPGKPTRPNWEKQIRKAQRALRLHKSAPAGPVGRVVRIGGTRYEVVNAGGTLRRLEGGRKRSGGGLQRTIQTITETSPLSREQIEDVRYFGGAKITSHRSNLFRRMLNRAFSSPRPEGA